MNMDFWEFRLSKVWLVETCSPVPEASLKAILTSWIVFSTPRRKRKRCLERSLCPGEDFQKFSCRRRMSPPIFMLETNLAMETLADVASACSMAGGGRGDHEPT